MLTTILALLAGGKVLWKVRVSLSLELLVLVQHLSVEVSFHLKADS
jgi:hypothetical protein